MVNSHPPHALKNPPLKKEIIIKQPPSIHYLVSWLTQPLQPLSTHILHPPFTFTKRSTKGNYHTNHRKNKSSDKKQRLNIIQKCGTENPHGTISRINPKNKHDESKKVL